jgi:hypothetical protein
MAVGRTANERARMTGGGNLEATSAPKGSFQVQLEMGGRRSALRLGAITETPSEYCKPNRKDVSKGGEQDAN